MDRKKGEKDVKISIIVPAYKAEATIRDCLNALLNQDYPKEDYEIIVVCNKESPDDTNKIVKSYPVKMVELDARDLSGYLAKLKARELGVDNAKYDLLLFTDADCVPKNDWLKSIRAANYQPLIGHTVNDKNRSEVDKFLYLLRKKVYPRIDKPIYLDEENFNKLPKGTDNFFCSKELFLKSSPKSDDLFVSDDIALFKNIIKEKKILVHPSPTVIHLERTEKGALFKQWHNRGRAFSGFYLAKGGAHHTKYIAGLFIMTLLLLIGIYYPLMFIYLFILIFIASILISIYFSGGASDFHVFYEYMVITGTAFILGVLRRKIQFFSVYFITLGTLAMLHWVLNISPIPIIEHIF